MRIPGPKGMSGMDTEKDAGRRRDSSRGYAALVKNMVNGFARHRIITDDKGKPIDYEFLEVNDSFERMTGLEREQVLGEPVTECIPEILEDEFDWIGTYGEVALTGKNITFDQYSRPLDRWYSVAAFSPKSGEFVTVFTDITEHVKTEEQLQKALEELQRLDRAYRMLTRGNQTMLKAQDEGRLLDDVCQVVVTTGGYPLAWIGYMEGNQGQKVTPMAVCGEDYGFVEQTIGFMKRDAGEIPFRRTLQTGEVSIYHQLDDRSGNWWGRTMTQHSFNSVAALPLNVAGNTIGFLSIYSHELRTFEEQEVGVLEELSRDLSYGIEMLRTRKERNGLEWETEEKSIFLEAILNSTQDGVLVVSNEREVIYTNQRFLELWKIPESIADSADDYQLVEHVKEQLAHPDKFQQEIVDLMRSKEFTIDVLRFKDGRVFHRASQPLLYQGNTKGRVWSFTDVTPIAHARNRAELYLDLLTHDIRNALQGVGLGMNLIGMRGDDPKVVNSALEQMEEAIARCVRLISKAQSIQGIEHEQLRSVSLTQAVQDCTEILRTQWSDVAVSLVLPDDNAVVMADSHLNQLIMNLLENAVKHNAKESQEVYVEVERQTPGYVLSIGDNGPGIVSARREELLDPGRRYGGVGLHIVSQIVEKYKGRITVNARVEADPSCGSEVRVWIPSTI